jgi:hypothetical protein
MALPKLKPNVVAAYASRHFVGRANLTALVDFLLLPEDGQDTVIRTWATDSKTTLEEQKLAAQAEVDKLDAQIAEVEKL